MEKRRLTSQETKTEVVTRDVVHGPAVTGSSIFDVFDTYIGNKDETHETVAHLVTKAVTTTTEVPVLVSPSSSANSDPFAVVLGEPVIVEQKEEVVSVVPLTPEQQQEDESLPEPSTHGRKATDILADFFN